ncbi:MAG: hypothetical protein ACR2NZ_03610 [Rubripirellula sp.]
MTNLAGVALISVAAGMMMPRSNAADRYHSDSNARYLHHIDLYDVDNRKITSESTKPFSSRNTCGRCHDYETIAHGWHFNAFSPDSMDGREGEPWIWTDPKTGTQLPLSYRDWTHTYSPKSIGLTPWEMTKQFGGRIPGGNMRPAEEQPQKDQAAAAEEEADSTADEASNDEYSRWPLSGDLEIDCMVCHAVSGAYDFNARRDQIVEENFAWAPTAGLHLGVIDGNVSRIKDGSDPEDDATLEKLPKVSYDPAKFSPDGTVFMDLIREPTSNACYQCHSNRTVGVDGIDQRWVHDEDVHLRAGMVCVDCHRNGIDHHIVRGFSGEENPSGRDVSTLSCEGCHLGEDPDAEEVGEDVFARAGRLGSPRPLHAGLPPVHFEKLSCTACHGGPVPRQEAVRIMTSLAHGLGEKGHRTGAELPAILGPVYLEGDDGRVYPQRTMWPAFWGTMEDGKVTPLSPVESYDLTRRALRVRKDFVEEVLMPKMSSSDLKKILGDDRARVEPEEWTEEEIQKVEDAQEEEGRSAFNEKVYAALEAIEKSKSGTAVYVSAGSVYMRGGEEDTLKATEVSDDRATAMVSWPMAHNVRPAGWSLGVAGCTECHSEEGEIFASTVSAIGPGPDQGDPITMASLQGVDLDQRLAWNELFRGRKSFKYIIGGSIVVLLMILMVGVGAMASRLVGKAA